MSDLLGRLPSIRRARGYRLYDHRGRRYLDLYQEGGRALLGHRPAGVGRALKGAISKGLAADLPSVYARRLEKALLRYFLPGYREARIYCCREQALEAAAAFLGGGLGPGEVADPALGHSSERVSLWRPLLEEPPRAQVLLPVLPFAMGSAPAVVCFRAVPPPELPLPGPLSPVILAGAVRALYELRRWVQPPWLTPDLLQGAPAWRQRGVYLSFESGEEEYAAVFDRFLAAGLLLAPARDTPSILPGEASPGELKTLTALLRHTAGG